jgi:hypothetical protein
MPAIPDQPATNFVLEQADHAAQHRGHQHADRGAAADVAIVGELETGQQIVDGYRLVSIGCHLG